MARVAVGLSGGVDSSVTAAILLEQGYDVTGVFIEAYNEPGCRTDQDKKDALQVALKLGIPFHSIDVRKEYKEKVVSYFFETYRRGATPNPDIVCNREVKFGIFYDWAMHNGFDYLATGHYSRIAEIAKNGSLLVQRAMDTSKDQSYFLWQVPQDHLSRIIWPLGGLMKSDVRQRAHQLGFPNADKPDSMGVCMMGELNVREFLKEYLGEHPGDVVIQGSELGSGLSSEPCIVGTHKGLWFHTVGQRGGFEINKRVLKSLGYEPEKMEPLYVIGKDVENNKLIIGTREQATFGQFSIYNLQSSLNLSDIQTKISHDELFVRIRNLGELEPVASLVVKDNFAELAVSHPLFGVAEGQAAVLYARVNGEGNEIVVGGGEISV